MTYREALKKASFLLEEGGIADAGFEIWMMMEEAAAMKRQAVLLKESAQMEEAEAQTFFALVDRRREHIPLQHLLGYTEFMGLHFFVSQDVLIPRQETELLVEEAGRYAKDKDVLDLCTGSGCIIISLYKRYGIRRADGSDISGRALQMAARNADYHKAPVTWIQGGLFDNIHQKYDILVSNPPYIESREIPKLMPEVFLHEPLEALDGGEDGLWFYREIAGKAKACLKPGGRIFLEIGYNQGGSVHTILREHGFVDILLKQDYAGHDRIISCVYES